MTDVKLALRGLRGESDADIARRLGSVNGVSIPAGYTDQQVYDALWAQSGADADRAEAALAEIIDLAANAEEAPSIANKLNLDGGNVADAAALRDNIGAGVNAGFVSVSEYYEIADGDDYGPALGRALAASSRVVWPKPATAYEISSVVNHTLTAETVIDWNDAPVTFSGSGRVNLKSAVVVGSGRTLASDAARGATSIVLNSGASIQAGDILNIQSNALPADWTDNKQDTVRVRSISGATVTLEDGLNFAWDSAETGLNVTVWRPAGAVIQRRPNFYLDETDGTGVARLCVYLEGVADWVIDGGRIEGPPTFTRSTNIYRNGVVAYYCHNGLIRGLASRAMSYPVQISGGSRYVREEGTTGRYNHHTNADLGGWSSDYDLVGLDDQDSFVALSTHACFRANATRCNVRNNTALTAWRSCGGSITDSRIHTIDSSSDTPQFQSAVPASGYEYIYTDRGDFTLARVAFDNPARSAPDVFIHYGARVVVEAVEGIDVRIGSTVVDPVIRHPLKLAGGKTGPLRGYVLADTAVPAPDVLDAYLEMGVYHIDPYRSLVAQSGRTFRCRGQVARRLAAGDHTVRLHHNGLAGVGTTDAPQFMVGHLKLTAIVQHESAGFFSRIEHTYPLGINSGGGAFVEMDTTPVLTVGPRGGSTAGADVTLALSAPAITTGTDAFIEFDASLGVSGSATNAVYFLLYELELTDASTAV